MDIKTLSVRTGIPVRHIRYVLDHELVPPRTWFVDEHAVGRARSFDEVTAVFIASAAFLLEAGYKRDSIRALLHSVSKVMPKAMTAKRKFLGLPVIAGVFSGHGSARVQFADGRYVRWYFGKTWDDWVDPSSTREPVPDLTPKVIVELNFGAISNQVLGRENPS